MDPIPEWERFVDDRLKAGSRNLYGEAKAAMSRELVGRVLRCVQGDRARAAEILGVSIERLGELESEAPRGLD